MAAPDAPLTGTVALVTGAGQGLGRAIARRLSGDGATVLANDIGMDERLESVVAETGATAVPADVTDAAAFTAAVRAATDKIGRPVGLLVANHAYMTMGTVLEHALDDWWKVVDTNLGGTFNAVQAVLPGMRFLGGGRIVVVSSEWGVTGWPRASAYSASKAGLISLVKTLGRELAPENILVNAIAPGVLDTPQLEVDAAAAGLSLPEMHAAYARGIPVGRIGRPDEVAATVAMLVDPATSAFVGQVVQVNGGSTRGRA